MVGVDKEERLYTGIWQAFKMRHGWPQVNLRTLVAGFVVSSFEGTIAQIVTLAAFLPIPAGQSGNRLPGAGHHAAGTRRSDSNHFPVRKLIRKELVLGALNGALTGIAGRRHVLGAWRRRQQRVADAGGRSCSP